MNKLFLAVILAGLANHSAASDYGLSRIVNEYNWSTCDVQGHVKSIENRTINYSVGTSDGKIAGSWVETYSPDGVLTSENCNYGTLHMYWGWNLYRRSDNGGPAGITYLSLPNGHTVRKLKINNSTAEFNRDGWIVSADVPETVFGVDGARTIVSHETWRYGRDGDNLAITQLAADNVKAKFWISPHGLLVEDVYLIGTSVTRSKYEYELDSSGNWTEKRIYNLEKDAQGKYEKRLISKSTRTIKYY